VLLAAGLDIGTSSSKAVIHDETGGVLASARVPTVWQTTVQGVEIDPHALLTGAVDALNAAVSRLGPGQAVAAVGITSMGETGVLVDRHGAPVAPAIAWHDQRDTTEVADLGRRLGATQFGRRAGKPLRGQFSLTKHRWMVDHDPAAQAAVRRFNVAEWIARGLGAEEACDRTLAGRTGWFDLRAGDWWDEALAWSGAGRSLMPPLVASGSPIGRISSDSALPGLRGAVLTLAGHDHQAASVGVGAVGAGQVFDSCGTAEAIVRTVAPTLAAEQIGWLAERGITTDESVQAGHWSLLGGTEGGLAMQRVLGLLGVPWSELPGLDAAALALPVDDPAGVTVGGIGAAALTISGVRDATGPAQLWRAVTAASAAAALPLQDAMTKVAGPHGQLIAAGGWCRSEAYLAAKRGLLGSVAVADVIEPGSRGAALLAARAAGNADADWSGNA
jgi:sugar (pentulose or hexulose) kinase